MDDHPGDRADARTQIGKHPAFRQVIGVRVVHLAIVIVFVALCLFVLHIFFGFTGNAPYMAVDDATANISIGLAYLKRLGFQASAIQGLTLAMRTDGFFNYGPWYFLAGGALSWLFGTSLEIQRALHPLGLMFISALAFATFRRHSLAVAGLFGGFVMYLFYYVHWPMARPDIMVATLGTASGAAATVAILSQRPWWWFIAAACAAGAITQHTIAGAVGPALALIWVLNWVLPIDGGRETAPSPGPTFPRRAVAASFVAAAAGALLATWGYLHAIHYRMRELLAFLTSYSADISNAGARGGYGQVLLTHLNFTWRGGVPPSVLFSAIVGIGLALVLLAALPWLPARSRRAVAALVLPPTVIAAAYQLSLGFYGNWHAGYNILSQMTVLWAGAGSIAAILVLVRDSLRRFEWLPELVVSFAVLAGLVQEIRTFTEKPSGWTAAAAQWVNIQDYVDRTLAPIPQHGHAWGNVIFGVQSGIRVDLVQMAEGIVLASHIKPAARDAYGPDFLAFAFQDLDTAAAGLVRDIGSQTALDQIAGLFPDDEFELINLVGAPPYGVTRVYQRIHRGKASHLPPAVQVNDGRDQQWSIRPLPSIQVDFEPAAPVSIELNLGARPRVTVPAHLSRGADLEEGTYLLTIALDRGAHRHSGVLIATNGARFTAEDTGLGYGFVPAPYFPDDTTTYLLVSHKGGPLYVSQFDADSQAGFRVVQVQPIEKPTGMSSAAFDPAPLPDMDQWRVNAQQSTIVSASALAYEMVGDSVPSGYQLASPPIPVQPHAAVTLTLPIDVKAGRVGIGVLNNAGLWVVGPTPGTNTLTFDAAVSDHLIIVISNVYTADTKGPTHFRVRRGTIKFGTPPSSAEHTQTYVDKLLVCHPTRADRSPALCQ